jgi:membrane associated rhomboid family serine protease
VEKIIKNIRNSVAYPVFVVFILWLTHGYFFMTQHDKSVYALLPRTQEGLWGVLCSPFMHANLEHLASNSLPLLVLMTGVIYFYRQISTQTLLLSFLFTQISVWCFARPFFHLGASGIVYSLFGFILGMGFFQRNIKSIVLALLVISFYGGMIWGVLPGQEGVSWESHLLGFFSGIFVAFLFRNDVEPDDDMVNGHTPFDFRFKPHDINKDSRDFFLPRNTFAGLRPKYTPIEVDETPEWQHFEQIFRDNYQNNPNGNPPQPNPFDNIRQNDAPFGNNPPSLNQNNPPFGNDNPPQNPPPKKDDNGWFSTPSW